MNLEANSTSIPYAKPYFPAGTASLLLDTFNNGQISGSGKSLDEFQSRVQRLLGSHAVLGVSNGSAALRLAFQALNLRPGARVVLPGWGFHVAANVAHSMGAEVQFRDVNQESWCLELESVQDLLDTDGDLVIVLIHSLGNSSSLKLANDFRSNSKIRIIEDSAEAFLSANQGRQLGTIFDVGTYSMHAAKTISTGEGGFIAINVPELTATTTLLRNHGMDPKNPYTHILPGDNFRISNLLASLAIPQLEAIKLIAQERLRVYRRYQKNLQNLPGVSFLKESDPVGFFPWGVCVRFTGVESAFVPNLRAALWSKGVDTRPGFTSAEKLPYYPQTLGSQPGGLVVSNLLAAETLLLPQYVELSNNQIDYICGIVSDFLDSNP